MGWAQSASVSSTGLWTIEPSDRSVDSYAQSGRQDPLLRSRPGLRASASFGATSVRSREKIRQTIFACKCFLQICRAQNWPKTDFFTASKGADDPDNSPTVTMGPTQVGVILGTAAYMSPEQARGREVDKREDIWAFGCVLYEMVTGKRAFAGENTADILAAVVKTEPDLTRAPVKVRRLLRRCLEKDPKDRLRDIGDVWELLDDEAGERAPSRSAPWARLGTGSRLAWAVAAVLAIIAITAIALLWRATRPVDHPLTRLNVDLGPEAMTGLNLTVAISPDGRRLVYPARGPDGK